MGYDLNVMIHVPICPKTGMPCEYSSDGLKSFDPCNYVVPEEHRKYINNRGWIFDLYIPRSCKEHVSCSVDASYLAKYIPLWSIIKIIMDDDWVDVWKEEDHNAFKAAMEWFGSKGCYTVYWSY